MNGELLDFKSNAMKAKPLVAIGLPCGDMLHSEMAQCLWAVGLASGDARQGVIMAHSSIVANARNNCVRGMLQINADYLFFIDSDMVFPPDTLNRLLKHDKDIIGGTYVRRGPPFDNLGNIADCDKGKTSGVVEMTHIPTGMLLIKRKVFEALRAPWFRYRDNEQIGAVDGEDMTFSLMAREAGFKLFCDIDLSIELRHLYTYMLSPMDPTTRAVAEKFKEAAVHA